ncbi:hypothetical protein ASG54_09395 [Aureimonas sp. Leaf460]|nr:hypothetical protein ASG62_06800 [Aureimonas sp. Leaf427]KQT79237.1 hypothetical protein ASG54_09395 [Aureimonas sp. Leaf460]
MLILLDFFSVQAVPTRQRRRPGETHARGTMEKILKEEGEAHLLLTLRCIRESAPNAEALSSETIAAVSDVLAQRPDWHERTDELLAIFDRIDLEALRERALRLRPWPVRGTMRAWLYLIMERLMDRSNTLAMRMSEAA